MSKFGTKKKSKHWAERAREVSICRDDENHFNVTIEGGADNAEFLYMGEMRHDRVLYKGTGSKLHPDDIILEVNGKRVSGLIRKDVISLIKRSADPLRLRVTKPGISLGKDLAHYLSTRFQKGSIDHELQQTIRDNLYTRTIPCTTRPPRPGEKSGVDYTFLSVEEFLVMERSNNLLESGLYGGNYYGTPKPPSDAASPTVERKGEIAERFGRHARSPPRGGSRSGPPGPSASGGSSSAEPRRAPDLPPLGPLPPNWEVAYTEDNEKYFIDHTTQTTHWLDPRIAAMQQDGRLKISGDGDVPYGWEKAHDPKFGTYYIDHINRRTSFEKPSRNPERAAPPPPTAVEAAAEAKRREAEAARRWPHAYQDDEDDEDPTSPGWQNGQSPSRVNNQFSPDRERDHEAVQSKNQTLHMSCDDSGKSGFEDDIALEAQLKGEVVHASLKKSPQGFGFTIVGGDSPGEVLQIKSIVKNGIAARSGKLQIGDVLVRVNGRFVLAYSHHEVVQLFQGVQVGGDLTLELRRGYDLPIEGDNPDAPITPIRLKPVPPPYPKDSRHRHGEPKSVPNNVEPPSPLSSVPAEEGRKVELLQATITKGQYGFGFTVAETTQGQKIKQIMDQVRCHQLKERDLLVQINGQNVRNYSHSDVVGILKQCPKGNKVTFVVERTLEGKKESNIGRQQHQTQNNQMHFPSGHLEDAFHEGAPPGDVQNDDGDMIYVTKEVELRRQAQGFGFRLVGGHEEGTQVYIGTIVPGGAADQSGQLKVDDEIMFVNGTSCAMATHKDVVGLLSEGGRMGQVHIQLRRKVHKSAVNEDEDNRSAASSFSDSGGLREIVLERRPEGGFGFVLQSSVKEAGCTICRIIPESPAEFCKKLHVGDHLLAVNGKDVTRLHHTDVVGIIKRSGLRVTLHVDQPDDASLNEAEQMVDGEQNEHFPTPPPPPLPPPEDLEQPVVDGYHTVQYDRQGGHGIEEDRQPVEQGEPWQIVRKDSRGRYEARNGEPERGQFGYNRSWNEADGPGRHRSDRQRHRDSPPRQQQQGYEWNRRSPPQHNHDRFRGHEDRGGRGSRRRDMQSPDQRDYDRGPRRERQDRREPPRYPQGDQRDRYHVHVLNNRPNDYHGHSPDRQRYNLDQRAMSDDPEVDANFEDGQYDEDVIDVVLKRDQQQGFGFSIRGGREYQNTPLFILKIAEDGVAHKDGRLRVGDEILEINGEGTADMRHTEAISLIKRGGDVVRLKVVRPPPQLDRHVADGHIANSAPPRRGGGDRRDYSPPRQHPSINQAVDKYYDQYMDSVKHRQGQGDAGYHKQSYKYNRGMGYNAP